MLNKEREQEILNILKMTNGFLDQSSTCFYLANELINRRSLTVVTNNTEILILLANSKINVISSGGYLSDDNRNCLIGGDAEMFSSYSKN